MGLGWVGGKEGRERRDLTRSATYLREDDRSTGGDAFLQLFIDNLPFCREGRVGGWGE